MSSGWSRALSSEEARTAAAHATIEMNGFAPFIVDLAESHPSEVVEVVGGEVSVELKLGDEELHLPTLQNLSHTDRIVKRLLVPRLLAELARWPDTFTDESRSRWLHHLERVLRILGESEAEHDRVVIAQECRRRYEADQTGQLALMWLKGLFQFDLRCGASVLIEALGYGSDSKVSDRAIETFAALFGGRAPVALDISDPAESAIILRDLIRCAYARVRREDDLVHKGAYSPNTRDEAEMARGFLLSRLLDTPGPEVHRVVLELSREEDFAHIRDHLRLLARRKMAAEADLEPFGPAAIIALKDKLEAPPHDRDSLFTVMMDRLKDLDHDFRHGDFSDRKLVRNAAQEPDLQRTLAWRLKDKANGAYKITREEESADQKRTDIRFLSVRSGKKAVAEVKIADKWSLNQLEDALWDQLVGQYLQHEDCKAGCLLLTYHGRKCYWLHSESKSRLGVSRDRCNSS